MVLSLMAIATGAVMYWAVSVSAGFRVPTVGAVFMIVGGAGLALSSALYALARNGTRTPSFVPRGAVIRGRRIAFHDEIGLRVNATDIVTDGSGVRTYQGQ
jgi:hypothetical protein